MYQILASFIDVVADCRTHDNVAARNVTHELNECASE